MPAIPANVFQNILRLEEHKGFTDAAVAGGLEAFARRWADSTAQADRSAKGMAEAIAVAFDGYAQVDAVAREAIVRHAAELLNGFQAGVHYAGHVHGIEQICNRVQLEPPFWTIRQFMWGLNGRVSSISADIYSNRLDESCGGQARGQRGFASGRS